MSLSRKAWLVVAGVIALLAPLAASVPLASPASAAPSSCYVLMASNRDGYSNCTAGWGQHRVVVYCKYLVGWGGVTRQGPWRGVNQQSWVSCPWGTVINRIYYGLQ